MSEPPYWPPPPDWQPPPDWRPDEQRSVGIPPFVLPLFALSMVFAFWVAAGAWYVTETTVDSSCSQTFTPGANIDHAWRLVLFATLGGMVVILLVRQRKRLMTALLLFEAMTLSVAIGLVALDSGTFRNKFNCHNAGQGTLYDTHHVASLEAWWAVPLAVLILLTVSVWWRPRGQLRA